MVGKHHFNLVGDGKGMLANFIGTLFPVSARAGFTPYTSFSLLDFPSVSSSDFISKETDRFGICVTLKTPGQL